MISENDPLLDALAGQRAEAGSPFVMRALTEADVQALYTFYQSLPEWVQYLFEPFRDPSEEVLGGHLKETANGHTISLGLVDGTGRILGHAFICRIDGESPMLGLGLDPVVHGQGRGRRMIASVLSQADALGVPRITLTVMKENAKAFSLYRKMGFKVTGESSCRGENDSHYMERLRPSPQAEDG